MARNPEQHIDLPQTSSVETPDFFSYVNTCELREKASATAAALVQNPALLADFIPQSETALFTANAGGDTTRSKEINDYLVEVSEEIRKTQWEDLEYQPLSDDSARTLLRMIPKTVPSKAKEPLTPQQQIIRTISRGYLTDRYEKTTNWRQALMTQFRLLRVAIEPQPDLSNLRVWYGLRQLHYQEIIPPTSTTWRCIYIGERMPTPEDENYTATAFFLDRSMLTLGKAMGTMEEVAKNSRRFELLNLQGIALGSTLIARKDPAMLLPGFVPATFDENTKLVSTKREYDNTFTYLNNWNVRFELYKQLNTNYSADDVRKARKLPLTPDLVELAKATFAYKKRADQLAERISNGFNKLQDQQQYLVGYGVSSGSINEFPFSVFLGHQQLHRKLESIFDTRTRKLIVDEMIQSSLAEYGTDYRALPFSIRGLNGFAVIKADETITPEQAIQLIDDVIKTYSVEQFHEVTEFLSGTHTPCLQLVKKDFEIILVQPEYARKSQIEALLDLKVPEEKRRKGIDICWKNLELARSIPQRFTRRPTRSGDRYDLTDHPNLPGCFRHGVIKKNDNGGLCFTLQLIPNPIICQEGECPEITGIVDFKFGRANIKFDETGEKLPADLNWLISSAVLHLVERSCCLTLHDVQEEQDRIRKEGLSNRSIPGYIGFVGGVRSDGTPKQYTEYAANNWGDLLEEMGLKRDEVRFDLRALLSKAVTELSQETGISLAEINQAYQDIQEQIRAAGGVPDIRALTYSKGRDSDAPEEPVNRSLPQVLIS